MEGWYKRYFSVVPGPRRTKPSLTLELATGSCPGPSPELKSVQRRPEGWYSKRATGNLAMGDRGVSEATVGEREAVALSCCWGLWYSYNRTHRMANLGFFFFFLCV